MSVSRIRVVGGQLLLGRITYHHGPWVMPLITTGGGVEGLLGPPQIGPRAVLARNSAGSQVYRVRVSQIRVVGGKLLLGRVTYHHET